MIDKLNKSDYKIKLINTQGVELKGYHFPANSDKWVMYVHGFAGGFDDFLYDIVNDCLGNNINFLFAGNQGKGTITQFKKYIDSSKIEIQGGGCYEDVQNIMPDIDCFVNFALNNGCKQLILIGYSFGCDKVVKYISSKNVECVCKLIFISPQDMPNSCDKSMLNQAIININNGEPNKVLDELFLGFCPISSKTICTLFNDKSINNFPYLSLKPNFDKLKQINIPTYFIMGSKDQGLQNSKKTAKECMQLLTSAIPNAKFDIVEGATHSYRNYYNQLCEAINKIVL